MGCLSSNVEIRNPYKAEGRLVSEETGKDGDFLLIGLVVYVRGWIRHPLKSLGCLVVLVLWLQHTICTS